MLRQRPPAFPIFENSITLVILVPLLLLLVISFMLSFVSHTCQIFRNNVVKSGWDLLNVVLVLFAILCGVVGKLYDTEMQVIEHGVAIQTRSVSDQTTRNNESGSFAIFDEFDFTINSPPASQIVQSGVNEVGSDDCNIKVIPVDTCVLGPAQSSAKAPPLPSNPAKSRPRRSLESVSPAKKQHEFVNIQSSILLRPPPPEHRQPHEINNTNIAKKSGAGKEIATAIVSLLKHTKRKTKHMTTNKNQKNTLSPPTKPAIPLPPPSVFHNMFRKATRTRRIHSEASASPPRSSSVGVKTKLFDSKPPLPKKMQSNQVALEYPEIRNVDLWSTMGSHDDVREGNQLGGSVLCPSPDVNVKADRFIARLRGEWKSDNMDYS